MRPLRFLTVGALLVVETLVGAWQVSVLTFSELADVINAGGASSVLVETSSPITFTHQLNLREGTVLSISSHVDATLSGGNAVRLFDLACESKLSLRSITLSRGHASGNGGIITMRCGSELTLLSTLISQSQASLGGSIHAVDSKIIMADSSFTLNTAAQEGGAIFAVRSTVTATHCTLSSNLAPSPSGVGGQSPAITEFGVTSGGAVFASNATVILAGCVLKRNMAYWGGAIHARTGSIVNISHSSFIGNSGYVGGATQVQGGVLIHMEECLLSTNRAQVKGGMIYMGLLANMESHLTMSHCSILQHSSYYGGVVYVDLGSVVATDCSFISNTANKGGVASLYGQGSLIISNSSFQSNQAKEGGAIAAYSHSVLSCSSCTMTANEADQEGGAIYASGSARVATTNCSLSNNVASLLSQSSHHHQSNGHGLGGAAYVESLAVMDAIGCSMHANSASSGGAIAVLGGSRVSFLSCTMASNRGYVEVARWINPLQ